MPKPVKRKKRFITKKESTTYKLIPGFVEDQDDVPTNETPEEIAARKEEERKYGVFYHDEYNYLKHMRDLNETAAMVNTEKFRLGDDDETKSVTSAPPLFFEMFSTDMNKGESIDPEILEALDEAPVVDMTEEDLEKEGVKVGGLESFLDDDFISKAGGLAPKPEPVYDEDDEEWSEEEQESDVGSDFGVSDDECGSEGMGYPQHREGRGTMQDDVAEAQTALILRNFEEGLGFHYSNQAPDDEPEMPTEADYEHFKHILQQDSKKLEPIDWSQVLDDKSDRPTMDPLKYQYEDEDEFVWKDAPKSKPKFDCVSILSLNSNTRNLPTDIIPPSSKSKRKQRQSTTDDGGDAQSSVGVPDRGLSLRQLEAEMRESRKAEQADRASTFRPQGETAEEKRARKKAIKDERKDRRQEKKANKQVFSIENTNMQKEAAALAKSVKSVRIC